MGVYKSFHLHKLLIVKFQLLNSFLSFTSSFLYITLLKTDLTNCFRVIFECEFRTISTIWLLLILPFWRFCFHSDVPAIIWTQILHQTAVDADVLGGIPLLCSHKMIKIWNLPRLPSHLVCTCLILVTHTPVLLRTFKYLH